MPHAWAYSGTWGTWAADTAQTTTTTTTTTTTAATTATATTTTTTTTTWGRWVADANEWRLLSVAYADAAWPRWATNSSATLVATITMADPGFITAATGPVALTWRAWAEEATFATAAGGSRRLQYNAPGVYAAPAREPTEAEKAEAAAERERRRRLDEAKANADAEADARAEKLLLSCLDPTQLAEYGKDKSFTVRAKNGRRYRLERKWSGHVTRLDDRGRPVERLCIHPRVSVPLPDNQLATKFLLENDPDALHRIANATPLPAGAG